MIKRLSLFLKDEYKRRFLSLNDSQSDQFVRLGTDEGTMGDPGHKSLLPGETQPLTPGT